MTKLRKRGNPLFYFMLRECVSIGECLQLDQGWRSAQLWRKRIAGLQMNDNNKY